MYWYVRLCRNDIDELEVTSSVTDRFRKIIINHFQLQQLIKIVFQLQHFLYYVTM